MTKKINCKDSLKKNIISKTVFEREIYLCQKLSIENKGKGCGWGKCKDCGVIPLLYKLHKGILIEDKKRLENLKKEIFGKKL
jgi:hypothetical protein